MVTLCPALAALEVHGIDPAHPSVLRTLEFCSDGGHVMYKQFFRDIAPQRPAAAGASGAGGTGGAGGAGGTGASSTGPAGSGSFPGGGGPNSTGTGLNSGGLGATVNIADLGASGESDKQKLARSRIVTAELRMEVSALPEAGCEGPPPQVTEQAPCRSSDCGTLWWMPMWSAKG